MKLFLISPASDLAKSAIYRRSVAPIPPIGLAYIASVLEKDGVNVYIEDQYATAITNGELLDKIGREKPDIVGLSCITANVKNGLAIASGIKAIDKNITVIFGNIHPTLFAQEMLESNVCDIVVRGEGEFTLREIVRTIKQHGSLGNVCGISYSSGGKTLHNPDRKLLDNLDELPYPDWGLLDLNRYRNYPMLGVYDVVLPLQGSRGCIYKCLFCAQDKIYPKARYRDIVQIVDEIEYMHNKYKVKCFGFNDAFFPFTFKSGMEFCAEMARRGLNKEIKWITETRVDMVNYELLKVMKDSGLEVIMYGFESGNQNVLNAVNKQITLKQAEDTMKLTKKIKIRALGLFMLGMPGDTKESCLETIRFAKRLDPDIAKFNLTVPLPGSRLFEMYRDKFKDADPDKFVSWLDWTDYKGEALTVGALSAKELITLQRKAMFDFYINPRKIIKNIFSRTFSLKDMAYGACNVIGNYLKIR